MTTEPVEPVVSDTPKQGAGHTPTPDEIGDQCARLVFSKGNGHEVAAISEHQLAAVCSSAIVLADILREQSRSALTARVEALELLMRLALRDIRKWDRVTNDTEERMRAALAEVRE